MQNSNPGIFYLAETMDRLRYYCFLFYLLCASAGFLAAQQLQATVNPGKPAVNQPFQVSFQLEGAQASRLQPPDFGRLQVLGGPSTFSNTQIVNGQVSQSFSYSYTLRAAQPGTYPIGKASVEVGGKKIESQPISVEVVAAAATGGNSNGQDAAQEGVSQDLMGQIADNVFLRAIVSKSDVYQGEQLTITYKLYTRAGLSGLEYAESPNFKDFWKEEFDSENTQFVVENYQGQQYNVATIKRAILFPQKAGKLEINPLKLDTRVQVRTQNRRRRSVFDDFFGGGIQEVPYTVSSGTTQIDAKPLPREGRPANFDGAVGQFELEVKLDKDNVQTGDAATFSVVISGKGNIKAIESPKLDFPPEFEVYDPKVDDKVSAASGTISGTKSFDYLIIPRNPGVYKLPVVSFSYFDPVRQRYVSQQSPAYTLTAAGEALQASGPGLSQIKKEDVELIGQDIRYIQTQPGDFRIKGTSFLAGYGFITLYVLPFLLFGGLLWFRVRQERLAGDIAGSRSRKAQSMAKKRLKRAREHMGKQEQKAFYDEIARAMWGFLSDKLNIGQSDLSREYVREQLLARTVPEALPERLTKLLDTCEMALFAPSAVSGGMESTYEEALSLISDIDNRI
jgi:hypothetical protein